MTTLVLKQFGDLKADDFRRHPVWVACHTADYNEQWYDDTDEETFRPWTGGLPVDPSDGMFLVRTTVVFCDKSTFQCFMTPAPDEDDLGTMQPQVFIGVERFGFWGDVGSTGRGTRQILSPCRQVRGRGVPVPVRRRERVGVGALFRRGRRVL